MKQQVFFIHGARSYSRYEDFLADLKVMPLRDLPGNEPLRMWSHALGETLGPDFETFTPMMPNKQNAKYLEWKIWFERYFEHLHDGVILVGWSQGGCFLAKYLIENKTAFTIKSLILCAAPFEPADFGGEDGGDFAFDTTQVPVLQQRTSNLVIMHSADDFVVPYAHALKYQAELPQAELVTYDNKNHFLTPEFPELISKIKAIAAD